ncbi:MAG: MMPL family transporter, partial [Gemmatimonadaceae bacterium]
ARRLDTGMPRGDWLPPDMESSRALHELQRMGDGAVIQSVRVVLELPPGVNALQPAGWDGTRRLSAYLQRDPGIARVRSLPDLAQGQQPDSDVSDDIPASIRRTFVSADGAAALVEALPREDIDPAQLAALVRALRTVNAATVTGVHGARLLVGGLPAFNVDYERAVEGRFAYLVGLIVCGTLLALGIGFRSVLIPLKAVALNLVSVAAAFGALVLVFQDGYGAHMIGLSAPVSGVFPAVPVIVFCIVFGLSMDYEIFLVARVAEARRAGFSEPAALVEALARTGGVITSASAIMIVAFGAFMQGGFLLMKMLGFALAAAVFIDATVVRMAVGPALLRLAGSWNWWPAALLPGEGQGDAAVRPEHEVLHARDRTDLTHQV